MKSFAFLAAPLLALAALPALAQSHGDGHGHPPGAPPSHSAGHAPGPALRFDARYHHDHYYPRTGYVVGGLPPGSVSVAWRGGSWWFHGGVWYRPYGPRWVVAVPPIGIVVPLLPPSYATLWIGGFPYYYANGVYYYPVGPDGYRVVEPPPGADNAKPAPVQTPKPLPDPILYPRNGQSPEQTERDRRECNTWATSQPNAMADASVFQRAVEACLDGRGYTVR